MQFLHTLHGPVALPLGFAARHCLPGLLPWFGTALQSTCTRAWAPSTRC